MEECWRAANELNMADRCEDRLADSFLALAVQKPELFSVLICLNLFGDLISDLAGGLVGSLGLCGSANIGDSHAVFEPAHGSAPDIVGLGVASPLSMVLSGAMMLRHLGFAPKALAVEQAVAAVVSDGILTPDLGGAFKTEDVTLALIKRLKD